MHFHHFHHFKVMVEFWTSNLQSQQFSCGKKLIINTYIHICNKIRKLSTSFTPHDIHYEFMYKYIYIYIYIPPKNPHLSLFKKNSPNSRFSQKPYNLPFLLKNHIIHLNLNPCCPIFQEKSIKE